MKRFLLSLLVFLLIPITAFGYDYNNEEYKENLSSYDLSFFQDKLDKDTRDILNELKLDEFSYESLYNLSLQDILNLLIRTINGKVKNPIQGISELAIFIIISSFLKSLKSEGDGYEGLFSTLTALVICIILLSKLSPVITLCITSIGVSADFIYAFVPVFCAIVVASGGITAGFSANAMLLILSQGMAFLSSTFVTPVINSFLSIGICASLRPQLGLSKAVDTVKRVFMSVLAFTASVYVSVLSIKTAAASKADMLGIRSLRFVITSVVPVIGGALSEGLVSIQAYSSLIKSSVGIIGIIAVVSVFLPSFIEIAVWRISLELCRILSDVFNDDAVSSVIGTFSSALLLLNVVLIISALTTIVSIGVLIASGS